MKKKILLCLCIVAMLICLFAISASASDLAYDRVYTIGGVEYPLWEQDAEGNYHPLMWYQDGENLLSQQTEKLYGINLGALTGGASIITTDFYYNLTDENNNVIGSSADGIVLCVYDYYGYQPHLQFETLSFVNAIISKYSDFLNTALPQLIN